MSEKQVFILEITKGNATNFELTNYLFTIRTIDFAYL